MTLLLLVTLTACSGGAPPGLVAVSRKPTPPVPGAPLPPDCVGTATSVALPPDVPPELKLPSGSVFTSVGPYPNNEGLTGYTIRGYAPVEHSTLGQELVTSLTEAGYRFGAGDAEANEVEALFFGGGANGGFRIRAIDGCPNQSLFELVFVTGS
jgi:hypothetical protein